MMIIGANINIIKEKTRVLLDISEEACLQVDTKRAK
jgi:hypothetical protein